MTTLILIFFAFLPFFPILPGFFGFDLPLSRLMGIIIFNTWLFRNLFKKDLFIPFDLKSIFFYTFLFFAGISGFWTSDKEVWLRKFLFLLNLLFLYLPIVQTFKNFSFDFSAKIFKVIFYSGIVVALLGIFQFLIQFFIPKEDFLQWFFDIFGPIFYGNFLKSVVLEYPSFFVSVGGNDYLRAFGFFPSPQNFALFLGIIFFLSFFIKNKIAGPVFYSGILAIILAILFTLSRGAYVALLMTTFILICYRLFNKKEVQMKVFGLLYIVLSMLVIFLLSFSPFMERFTDIFLAQDTSRQHRIELWRKSLMVIKENPFFGVGLGNLPIYIEPDKNLRAPVNAHNTYLEIWAELGLVGFVLFILIFLSLIYKMNHYALRITNHKFKITHHKLRNTHHKLQVGGDNYLHLFYPILYFLILSIFETTIYFFPSMALLMLILGFFV